MEKDINKTRNSRINKLLTQAYENGVMSYEDMKKLQNEVDDVFKSKTPYTYDTMADKLLQELNEFKYPDGIYTALGDLRTINSTKDLKKLNESVFSIFKCFTERKTQMKFVDENEIITVHIPNNSLNARLRNLRKSRNEKFKNAFDEAIELYGESVGLGTIYIKAKRAFNVYKLMQREYYKESIGVDDYIELESSLIDSLLDMMNYCIMFNTVVENKLLKEKGLMINE